MEVPLPFLPPQLTFGARYCFYRYLSFCSQEGSASKGGLPPGEASDTTGYGRQIGGMHATGMHTCFNHINNKNAFQVGCVPPAAVAIKGGGVSAQLGVSAQGGVSAWGVGCLPREVSARHTPVDRMTDTCKKYYLAATTFRTLVM